jgi:membrane protein
MSRNETNPLQRSKANASMWKFGGLGWKNILGRLWRQFQKDRVLDESAMLSFYFLLSIFPFLIFLAALLGLILQSGDTVHGAIQNYLTKIAPGSASGLIDSTLHEIRRGSNGSALWLSLLMSLWVASSGLVAIIEALNVAYEVEESRPWWKQRLVALGLTIGLVLLFAGALVVVGYGGPLSEGVSRAIGFSSSWATIGSKLVEWLLLLGFLLMGFNLLYIFAPNVKHHRWHWLMPGTALAVTLWLVASFGFKLYLKFFNTYNLTYGSIAAVIILLLWFYLSGIAILVGGELNSELEKETGKVQKRSS